MDHIPTLRSTAVPLPIENIEIEQIIPARFLKPTSREGCGANLFANWRYAANGERKHGFVLNDTRYHGQIMLVGENFGCGENCEQAAWALFDAGFRVLISSSFPQGFRHYAFRTGLLPLQVSREVLQRLFARVTHYPNTQLLVDVPTQMLRVPVWEESIPFDLDANQKVAVLKAFAEVEYPSSRPPSPPIDNNRYVYFK